MAESLRDAIIGGLLGVAAGDALGATVEFMTPEEIQKDHGSIARSSEGAISTGGRAREPTTRTSHGLSFAATWKRMASTALTASPERSWSGLTPIPETSAEPPKKL